MGARIRGAALAGLALAGLALAGCGSQGDFGRDRPSLVAERLGFHRNTHTPGYEARNLHTLQLTPAESELRMNANALIRTYAHRKTHGNFSEMAPLAPRKVLAVIRPEATADGYAAEMMRLGYRSNDARLYAITDDMRADPLHIDRMWAAVVDVYDADSARIAEIEAGAVRPSLAEVLLARIEENRALIDVTIAALGERVAGYRLALSDAYVARPGTGYAGARAEYAALRRKVGNFMSNVDGLGRRHALTLPQTDGCVTRSLGRLC